jgi:hypothetical protein
MVGVSLIKTLSDSPRSCAISGSSRKAAVCWLSQAGWAVVYTVQADRIAEKKASLGTLRHSSELSDKLPYTPLKLSILPARNQFCTKLPLLTSDAMHHALRRLMLVKYGGCLQLFQKAVICLCQMDNLKLSAHRYCDGPWGPSHKVGRCCDLPQWVIHWPASVVTGQEPVRQGWLGRGGGGCKVGRSGCTAVMSTWMLPMDRLYDTRLNGLLL